LGRVILHIDLDAFYASVEQRENPSLRGKPLIIGADPKEGKGRGVVVTCSYEARKHGLRSGMPISKAYRLCPDGIYIRPNFELYGNVSADVMALLKKYADKFEQVSIDEAYLDVTRTCERFGGPVELAKRIKSDLRESERLTCSIGIAPNKSVAKIASDFQKPDGLTYVDPSAVKDFLAPLPVSKISGIGPKTEKLLNELGVRTIGDLAEHSPKDLYNRFGKAGVWMWAIASGEENVEVQENYTMKSIGAEYTFDVDTGDWSQVEYQLRKLIDTVHTRLLEERMMFRTVTLKIRFTGFETHTHARSLRFPTSNKQTIVQEIRTLSETFKSRNRKVRLVGVRLSGLSARPQDLAMKKTIDQFT